MRRVIAVLSLALSLFATDAHALSLEQDPTTGAWCAGTATCIDSAQAGGDYVAQASRLVMGSDTVDLFTGELRVSTDDVRIPGPHGLDLALVRTYSSKIADERGNTVETSWAGLGWQVLPGGRMRFEPSTSNHVWLELPGRGRQRAYALSLGDALYRDATDTNAWPGQASTTAWVTKDFTFVYDAGGGIYRAITTQGVVYQFDTGSGPEWNGWTYGDSVFNAHGDTLTLGYDTAGQPGALVYVSDGASRSLNFATDINGFLDSVSWTNASGGSSTIDYTVATATDGSAQDRLTHVILATGETYDYGYAWTSTLTDRGELSAITLPTGSALTYSYETLNYLQDVDPETGAETTYDTRVVSQKIASPDDGFTSYTWTYGWDSYAGDPGTNIRTTTVELPDGTWLEHDYIAFSYTTSVVLDTGAVDTGGVLVVDAVDRAQIGMPLETRVYADSTAMTPTLGRLTQYVTLASTWNLMTLSSASDNPYTAWVDSTQILLPYDQIEYRDVSAAGTSGDTAYRQLGDAGTDYDAYGNNLIHCEAGVQPFYGDTATQAGPVYQQDMAWVSYAALEGWNLVHLPELVSTFSSSTGSSTVCSTGGTVLSSTSTAYATTGFARGWPSLQTRAVQGDRLSYTSLLPVSNPSADETLAFSYADDSVGGYTTTVDIGGSTSPLRTRVLSFQYGALAIESWVDGATVTPFIQRTVDGATGLVTAQADANGNLALAAQRTSFSYDATGILTSVTPALGDATTWTRSFGSYGAVLTATVGSLVETTILDGLGRVLSSESPSGVDRSSGTAVPVSATVDQEWDGRGRITDVWTPHDGTPTGDAQTTWDELSRPTYVDVVDGAITSTTSWTYSGESELRTDPLGVEHSLWRNYRGEIERNTPASSVTAGVGAQLATTSGANPDHAMITATLDANTDLTGLCYHSLTCGAEESYQIRSLDQAGRPWLLLDYQALAYDSSGWSTDPDSRLFERNVAGDVACEVWDNQPTVSGQQLAWIRRDPDFAGRPAQVAYGTASTFVSTCPASASPAVAWTYDAVPFGSTWTGTNLLGHPVQVEDESGVRLWGYDQQGRVIDSHQTWTGWPGVGVDIGTTTDSLGRLDTVSLTWDTASSTRTERIAYSYANGRLDTVDVVLDAGAAGEDTVPIISSSAWQPTGHPASLVYGNGVTATWTDDGLARTTGITTNGIFNGTSPANLNETIAYDGNGNVDTVTTDSTATDSYSYDEIDRLLQVAYADGSTIDYDWDDLGDMVYRDASAPSLSYLNFGSLSSTRYYGHVSGWYYDGAGQVTATDTATLTWHALGKPDTIQDTDWTEITYDYAGRRAIVHGCAGDATCTGAQQWNHYLYDDSGRVLARFDSQGPGPSASAFLAELYVYAGNQLVAFVDFSASHPLGAVFWMHSDAQGSLRRVTDSVGQVARDVSWTPFGAVRSDAGSPASTQDGLAYAWQSAPYDHQAVTDVGIRARDAQFGWFLSPDPVAWGDPADPQSFHRSQYARGNPMTFVDPSGAGPELAWLTVESGLTFVDMVQTGESALGVYQGNGKWGELGVNLALTAAGMMLPGGGATVWARGSTELETAGVGAASKASSRTLGRGLEAAGQLRPANSAAHHIVAGGAEAAAPARAVLKRFGIGVNDAANGVFLPASTNFANPTRSAVHSTLHTNEYYKVVNSALGQATTRDEALDILVGLSQQLVGGGL